MIPTEEFITISVAELEMLNRQTEDYYSEILILAEDMVNLLEDINSIITDTAMSTALPHKEIRDLINKASEVL
jgi:hypothetical protein